MGNRKQFHRERFDRDVGAVQPKLRSQFLTQGGEPAVQMYSRPAQERRKVFWQSVGKDLDEYGIGSLSADAVRVRRLGWLDEQ